MGVIPSLSGLKIVYPTYTRWFLRTGIGICMQRVLDFSFFLLLCLEIHNSLWIFNDVTMICSNCLNLVFPDRYSSFVFCESFHGPPIPLMLEKAPSCKLKIQPLLRLSMLWASSRRVGAAARAWKPAAFVLETPDGVGLTQLKIKVLSNGLQFEDFRSASWRVHTLGPLAAICSHGVHATITHLEPRLFFSQASLLKRKPLTLSAKTKVNDKNLRTLI